MRYNKETREFLIKLNDEFENAKKIEDTEKREEAIDKVRMRISIFAYQNSFNGLLDQICKTCKVKTR